MVEKCNFNTLTARVYIKSLRQPKDAKNQSIFFVPREFQLNWLKNVADTAVHSIEFSDIFAAAEAVDTFTTSFKFKKKEFWFFS